MFVKMFDLKLIYIFTTLYLFLSLVSSITVKINELGDSITGSPVGFPLVLVAQFLTY